MVKVTKEKLAENRAALVEAASRLFRERGIDGVGVAEISKAAGLRHGGLYAQFRSKEALAAEALAHGLRRANGFIASGAGAAKPTLTSQLDYFLSKKHRDASEVGRQNDDISARFSAGFEELVGIVESSLSDVAPTGRRHDRALAIVAAMIGGVAVARATAKSRPDLSAEILAVMRRTLGDLGGEGALAPARKKSIRRTKAGGTKIAAQILIRTLFLNTSGSEHHGQSVDSDQCSEPVR